MDQIKKKVIIRTIEQDRATEQCKQKLENSGATEHCVIFMGSLIGTFSAQPKTLSGLSQMRNQTKYKKKLVSSYPSYAS